MNNQSTVHNYMKVFINFITKTLFTKKMRKYSAFNTTVEGHGGQAKQMSHSVSTEESPRPKMQGVYTKEKSQLCKKFMENGYCCYEQRCKFAHGLHQLRKNDQTNCKYKTRDCGGYLHAGYCLFGDRCNFIHPIAKIQASRRLLDADMMEIIALSGKQSRLLKILKNNN